MKAAHLKCGLVWSCAKQKSFLLTVQQPLSGEQLSLMLVSFFAVHNKLSGRLNLLQGQVSSWAPAEPYSACSGLPSIRPQQRGQSVGSEDAPADQSHSRKALSP